MTQDAHYDAELVEALSPRRTSPVAVIRRGDSDTVSVYTGPVKSADVLADIPLDGQDVIAAIPFRQISERGFDVIEDDAELLYLTARSAWEVPVSDLIALLPNELPDIEDLGFDISDADYESLVDRVIKDEIGTGQGANFVIRRDYRARISGSSRNASLAWLRQLLEGEQGAYWTFAFITPDVALVGASPERHVSAADGTVKMNPISGTFRRGTKPTTTEELLTFLADRKESEELVMVVDEELKMMSSVCPGGGVMHGPYLKPMSRLIHTEYMLEGKSELDIREILRRTMFAPTVTGSPMQNACSVIARYEPSGRGYYSGVLAHFQPTDQGYELDAPILIRTAQISAAGEVVVSAGATLVRHSTASSEAKETSAKVSGMLTALGLLPPRDAAQETSVDVVEDARASAALAERNRDLAPFWRDEQPTRPQSIDATVLVVDCGDDFTTMLAHQLRHLGMSVTIKKWDEVTAKITEDLVVFGPGPGDPIDEGDPRILRLQELMKQRIDEGRATVAVCLSHQVLSALAGLEVRTLPSPRQGQPLEIDLLGEPSLIGFYNTYAAYGQDSSTTPALGLRVHAEPDSGIVHSLTAPGIGSVQGHLESVLSFDGFEALGRLVDHALQTAPATTVEPGTESDS